MKTRAARWLVLALLAAVACEDRLDLQNRPCPCIEGYECCAGLDRPYCAPAGGCPPPATLDATEPAPHGASPLATEQSAQCMAQDDGHVYWVNDDGRLFGAPKDGGPAVGSRWIPPGGAPISSLLPAGCKLVIDGAYAYATLPSLGKIARVSLFTNGAWDIGEQGLLFGDLSLPSSLALDADAVYVTQSDTALVTKMPRPPLPGADGLAPDGGAVDGGAGPSFSQRTGNAPSELVAGQHVLFWFDGTGLRTMDKAGGTIATVGTYPGVFLALAGASLYWRQKGQTPPWLVPVSGGNAAQVPWQAWTDYDENFSSIDGHPAQARALALAADVAGCDKGAEATSDAVQVVGVPTAAGSATADADATLSANDHELVFSTETRFHRASIPGGSVEDMFTYRGVCSSSSRARIVLFDATQVYWADMNTVWRHPRN